MTIPLRLISSQLDTGEGVQVWIQHVTPVPAGQAGPKRPQKKQPYNRSTGTGRHAYYSSR